MRLIGGEDDVDLRSSEIVGGGCLVLGCCAGHIMAMFRSWTVSDVRRCWLGWIKW